MPTVHPTSVLDGDVQLAPDVEIGPNCVVTGPVTIGAGTRLVGNVYLHGPLTLGRDNIVYPFTCLGFAPQHAKFDPRTAGEGTVIGDGNTIREHVTVHRAFADDGPTRIGDRGTLMVACHVGHDSRVGNDVTLVNGALLAGHVTVDDDVIVGGGTPVHQFCRVGRGAMLGGGLVTTKDVPPYFMLTGASLCGGVNLVGLRRSGASRERINEIRWVYRTLCRSGLGVGEATEVLRERGGKVAPEYVRFIEGSQRGICTARGQVGRGTAMEARA